MELRGGVLRLKQNGNEYRAFGEQLKRLSHSGEEVDDLAKYSYSGKELDVDTNPYYFNARWYDAELGRFISEDPIRDGLNWLVYANNNPLKFVDPTGLATLTSFSKENPYFYYHSSKTLDIVTKSIGLLPYIGIGMDIAKGLNKLTSPFTTIDLNNQSFLANFFSSTSTIGSIAGVAGEFVSGAGKIAFGASKTLGVISGVGTFMGATSLFKTLFLDHSIDVEKAVEVSGVVQGDNLETLIPFAKKIENMMYGYLEDGSVEISQNDDGEDVLQWNSAESKETFDYAVKEYQDAEIASKELDIE